MNLDQLSQNAIWKLGQWYGIEPVYYDGLGVERQIEIPHLQQILLSMGVKASSENEIQNSLSDSACRQWTQMLEPVMVRYRNDPTWRLTLSLPLGGMKLEQVSL